MRKSMELRPRRESRGGGGSFREQFFCQFQNCDSFFALNGQDCDLDVTLQSLWLNIQYEIHTLDPDQ